jgi:hypothetical protein
VTLANSTDKWAKGQNAAYFNEVIKNTKSKMQTKDESGRTDNSQQSGKQDGPKFHGVGDGAKEAGANARGQSIHQRVIGKGPGHER